MRSVVNCRSLQYESQNDECRLELDTYHNIMKPYEVSKSN